MADPGMLSLFGDDAGLFADGLDGLGDCGFPPQPTQGQANPLAPQTNPSMGHEHQGAGGYHQGLLHGAGPGPGQPKLGQMYDHGPYSGYDQTGGPGGRLMGQNGPSQGPPNVTAMNGMGARYHSNPANPSNPHHVYTGDSGGGGGVWGQQQSRPAYQQPPTQPGGGPNQMGAYQMSRGDYVGMQGPASSGTGHMNQHYPPQSMAPPAAQDSSLYLGHVGMGGAQIRHPQPQPQAYPNMGHTPRYPHSPSRQPPHPHQHHQGMGGFGGGQYPRLPGPVRAHEPGVGPRNGPGR